MKLLCHPARIKYFARFPIPMWCDFPKFQNKCFVISVVLTNPSSLCYGYFMSRVVMASTSETSDYVTLVSSDGFEFQVLRSCATIAGAIKRMLDPSSEFLIRLLGVRVAGGQRLCLRPSHRQLQRSFGKPLWIRKYQVSTHLSPNWEVLLTTTSSGVVLEKVCEYFYYNERNKDARDVPDMDIPPELCLELLVAADYLNT